MQQNSAIKYSEMSVHYTKMNTLIIYIYIYSKIVYLYLQLGFGSH